MHRKSILRYKNATRYAGPIAVLSIIVDFLLARNPSRSRQERSEPLILEPILDLKTLHIPSGPYPSKSRAVSKSS